MKLFERSILRRLLIAQLIGLSLYLVVEMALTYRAVTQFGSGDFDREMSFTAAVLAKLAQIDAADAADLADTARVIEQVSTDYVQQFVPIPSYRAVLQLWTPSGELLFRSAAAPSHPLAELKPGIAQVTLAGEPWRVATARSPNGRLYAQIAESGQMREEMAQTMFGYFLPRLWLAVPLLLVFSWIACVRGLRPLRALARQIRVRSAADLSHIDTQPAYAETQPLANAINDLIRRIEQTLAHERNFLADAAHELRTPLAALQTQVHVLAHAQSEQERGAAEEDMHGTIARCAALLRQLLVIARLESDAGTLTPQTLDLAALVQDRVAVFGKSALEKSIDLELMAPAACTAVVDRDAMVSLIDNLVDNAVRYVPAGGHVCVSLTGSPEHVELSVADDGPGILVEQHERVFERFFRVPGNDEPGSGLGLAIARSVASLHGGSISLGPGIGGRGLTVRVVLPGRTDTLLAAEVRTNQEWH